MSAPRYKSTMDYVLTLRAAASSPSAAFWWFDHSLRSSLVTCCAFHYLPMWQAFSILNIQPQPQWATDALLGTRQGEGSETGVTRERDKSTWDSSKVLVLYHSCLPSALARIIHDDCSRTVGQGAVAMQEVLGCITAGIYCYDRPEAASQHVLVPARGGASRPNEVQRRRVDHRGRHYSVQSGSQVPCGRFWFVAQR